MALFDDLAGQATAALSGLGNGAHPGLLGEVSNLLGGNGGGGLQSLLGQFQEKGLGDAVASWIGTGQNSPISAEQLQSVLGTAQVAAIAQKVGISPADASSALARMIPEVVDHLSPGGQLPAGNLLEQGLSLLKSFGGGIGT
jgi:uncharacterized protein YidB (DUF937 family)